MDDERDIDGSPHPSIRRVIVAISTAKFERVTKVPFGRDASRVEGRGSRVRIDRDRMN